MCGESDSTLWSMSLVPVQSWIASARRSRDLLAGSAILSWLTARLLGEIARHGGGVELPQLSPALLGAHRDLRSILSSDGYGIPNRASGRVPLDLDAAETLFTALQAECLPDAWRAVIETVSRATARSHPGLWRLLRDEVEAAPCPVQLVWCLQDGATSDLERIDRLFAAVKRSRTIQPHRGAAVPKCGQCGLREAVGGTDPAAWRAAQERLEAEPSVQTGERLAVGERLCAPCVVKRLAGYLPAAPFPSTSAIAARPWRAAVASVEPLAAPLRALEDAAGSVPGYDGATADIAPLYFARSLEREQRLAAGPDASDRRAGLDRVAAAQERLRRAIRELSASGEVQCAAEPSQYLAVLAFDGDQMARHGRNDPDLALKVASFQDALAARLRGADEAIPDPGGALHHAQAFYLGGDEGLLLAPVERLLGTAFAVHALWVEAFVQGGDATADPPTLSMGLAVFDRERALGAALDACRSALDAAKDAGRDRLAVRLVTASGLGSSAIAPWRGWERARAAADLLRSGRLARGWPHDLGLFLRTLPSTAWTHGATRDAIRAEVRRLTGRRAARGEDPSRLWAALDGDRWWEEQPSPDVIASVGDQLHLIAFLTRETRLEVPRAH